AISDSRFQDELMEHAKKAGKLERDFQIPRECRDNLPERIERTLMPARAAGLLDPFPFGSDFTPTEQRLIPALKRLASASPTRLAALFLRGFVHGKDASAHNCLDRMGLAQPSTLSEWFNAALLRGALLPTSRKTA